ncbi:hypothetical protein [Bellilinea caldifistulae]|uniref:Uncharacterized protein n=2 Tax=Bellilinea caldifistulae TaxID=360411 RepID=A0A0P6XRY5_9CHLR|nr:hypothetical protein [Bellilinea caldifistulae]KPL75229.1 hypothetical protein AC812_09730 [Bellilinea caldifistulae]
MNTTSSLITELRLILRDLPAVIWSEAELTHALRQAYHDLLAASGEDWLINGLDGETNPTTLPPILASLLLRGALGYALLGRAAERLDAFDFHAGQQAAALTTARILLDHFQKGLAGLNRYRLRRLQSAENPPYPPAEDPLQPGWPME